MDLGFGAANDKNPVVLVIGDAYVSEIYDGPGSCVIILHVDGARFGALKDFVLKVFANKTRSNAAVLVSAIREIRRLVRDTSGPSIASSKLGCTGSLPEVLAVVFCWIFLPPCKNQRMSAVAKLLLLLFFPPQAALS